MDFLNSVAHTVYLRADADTICAHLSVSKGRRPLLEGKSPEELRAFVTTQLAERSTYYERAQHIVDVHPLDTHEKVGRLSRCIIDDLGIALEGNS